MLNQHQNFASITGACELRYCPLNEPYSNEPEYRFFSNLKTIGPFPLICVVVLRRV